jgi:hypothetical protein
VTPAAQDRAVAEVALGTQPTSAPVETAATAERGERFCLAPAHPFKEAALSGRKLWVQPDQTLWTCTTAETAVPVAETLGCKASLAARVAFPAAVGAAVLTVLWVAVLAAAAMADRAVFV